MARYWLSKGKTEKMAEEAKEEQLTQEEMTAESGAEESTDESQNAAAEEAAGPEEKDEVEELKNQVAEIKDKYLRLFADFDNFKKRTVKEKTEIVQTATKDLMIDLLPVLDDFERAGKSIEEAQDMASVKEGMQLVHHKLKHLLEQRGLKAMDAIGEDFDTDKHEALTEIPAPTDDQKGKVVDQIERGYQLNEKIIRYAKVVVGK